MSNNLYNVNFLNLRNLLLIFGTLTFLGLSIFALLRQRIESFYVYDYTSAYIIGASVLIIILVLSIAYLVLPIIIRVKRKKISTLNSKFTLYFVSIALTPAIILGVIGMMLINLGINDWFNSKINNVIDNSVLVAESYLEEHKETIKGEVYTMYSDINSTSDVLGIDINRLKFALRTQALIRSLPETFVLSRDGRILAQAFEQSKLLYSPPENAFERADNGEMAIMSSTQVNKVYALVKLDNYKDSYLFAGRSMDENVLIALNDTVSAKNEYTFLEENRNQISLTFILLYVIISLFLVLLSTFFGLKFAERIVFPISSVIKATNNISEGRYDNKIKKTNDYVELNRLAESFNKMSDDIVKQRKQILISKKHETWSDIARRIAHEIKNPLTPIQLSSDRLEKKLKDFSIEQAEIFECVSTIRRQVNEIGYLVDEFSNFARLPMPKLNEENIHLILREVIKDYRNNYTNILFEENYCNDNFHLKVDRSQILRALKNIIINSIHSIEENNNEKGLISITTKSCKKYLKIILQDNGRGLKFTRDELIKPYFTTKKKIGGTGLGLAIVEKILFDHNADFSIDNREDKISGALVEIKFER